MPTSPTSDLPSTGRILRVLHILEALEGGTSRHLIDLVSNTRDVEHHVAVPETRIGGATDRLAIGALAAAGARVHIVPMTRKPLTVLNLRAGRRLRRLIKDIAPTVVHTHSSIGGFLGRLANIGTGRPVVYTPNGVSPRRPVLIVERLLGKLTDRTIAVSESESVFIQKNHLVSPSAVTVIPNGVDLINVPPPIDLRRLLPVREGSRLVGSIARLVPQKAPEVFVAACSRLARSHDDVEFVLVGDGTQVQEIHEQIAASNFGGRFHLIPELPKAAGMLEQLDVFALTSRFEGCPYAAMEAMRARVPIVLTDAVGNRDLVCDGVDGILVPQDDDVAVAAAVASLLDDQEHADKFTESAYTLLSDQHDLARTSVKLRLVYDELVGVAESA